MIDEVSALEELERRRMYGKPPTRQPDVISLNIKEYAAIRLFVDVPTVRNKQDALEALRSAEYRQGATHTSPPAPVGKLESACEDCDIVHECYLCYNDVAPPCVLSAAKAEREQVLDELYKWICEDRGSLHRMQIIPALILHSLVIEKIESLRQPEPQQ